VTTAKFKSLFPLSPFSPVEAEDEVILGPTVSLSGCQATIKAGDQFLFLLEIFLELWEFGILWRPL
jgi:hypothetical protein